MNKFGIVGEGYTDKVVIENILRGYFTEQNLDDEINPLPESDKGGWDVICKYLSSRDFRNDVSNHQILIFQIDSDITTKEEDAGNFGVFYKDEQGNELSEEELIANIITQLVYKINTGKSGFYELYSDKIIFAISVHCTECWLVAAYIPEKITIHDCDKVLLIEKLPNNIQFSKKQSSRCHERLSQFFLIPDNINIVAQKSPSFNLFIQQLHNITL
jgi:hypothetical protein